MNTKAKSRWDAVQTTPEIKPDVKGRSVEDVAEWEKITTRLKILAKENDWSQGDVSKYSGVPNSTISQWYNGTYPSDLSAINTKMENWLDAYEEDVAAPQMLNTDVFVETQISKKIWMALQFAQSQSDVVAVTVPSGFGKTHTLEQYKSTKPHVHLVTMSPNSKKPHGMLMELARKLGVHQNNATKMVHPIGKKLERVGNGTLLIMDEAQNLETDAINQVRHFADIYKCGIALVGNNEVYQRLTASHDGPSHAQIKSRMAMVVNDDRLTTSDINMVLNAWSIDDPDMRKFLTGICRKDGAFRQAEKTLQLANIIATGAGKSIDLETLRLAWSNRNIDGVAK